MIISARYRHALLTALAMLVAVCGMARAATFPTVTTYSAPLIDFTTVTLNGNVTSDGGSKIIARGVVYAQTAINSNPQLGGTGVSNMYAAGTTGIYCGNVSDLTPGTIYCCAAYATNSIGTSYSAVSTFYTYTPFSYSSVGGNVTITGYSYNGATFSCPLSIYGMPVTSIGNNAFQNCNIRSITIPSTVTSIGSGAFQNCTGLTSITIPSSITSIKDNTFSDCRNLQSITIPASVTSIGDYAFYACTGLTSITIPASVISVGSGAFEDCMGLTSITIPASVTDIGDYAFSGCMGLTNITIPAGVISIGDYAFDSCVGLTSITISASVISIGSGAFEDCMGLASITIPASVTDIGDYAFSGCMGLTNITIPASVISIGDSAFDGCTELTSITVDSLNAKYSSLGGVLFDKNQTLLIRCPSGKTGAVTIPASVTGIGNYAFSGCMGLTSITIPASVTSIGFCAFENCCGLTSIALPAGVTSIGDYAFSSCAYLTSIIIPSSVTSIGGCAFYNCTMMTSAFFTGNAPSMGIGVFDPADSDFTVYYFNDKSGFTSPSWQGYTAVNMGNSTPAATWLLVNNLPYNADLRSDPNGDGVSLLMAYALNLDPKQNLSGSMPKPVIAGNQMSLSFYAGSAGVTYSVQSSTDLQTWSTTGVTLSNPDANYFRTATVNQSGPKRFLRIVAGY